jgi:hypothetical protein
MGLDDNKQDDFAGEDDAISTIKKNLAPADDPPARKQSNVSSNQGNSRKQSLVAASKPAQSEGPAYTLKMALSGGPRKRYKKEDLLSKFKRTADIDQSICEASSLQDQADLFVKSGTKGGAESEADARAKILEGALEDSDEDEDEAKEDPEETQGLLPESVQRTGRKPDRPL